jgi:hypothetical protein
MEHNIVSREEAVSMDGSSVDRFGGKSTGVVRAKNGDACQFFDGGDMDDNSLVLGELLSTSGESDGQNSGHGNGNSTDQKASRGCC